MTATAEPLGALLWKKWRDKTAWMTSADIVAVLLAFALPWSTSLVGILGVVLVLVMLPTIDISAFIAELKRPIAAAPIALFALALVGTLWSDARWGLRFYAVAPTAKLLLLPLLFYHFERSERGLWVFKAFLASCAVMVVVSWIVAFFPELTLKTKDFASRGIFVKNYIDQSQEFALCAVALAYPIATLLRAKKLALALLLGALALGFLANMVFVIVSRTALVTIPIMLLAFALLHLRWQTTLMVVCAAAFAGILAWFASPQLEATVDKFGQEYRQYVQEGAVTSIGERLEYYRKSLGFFAEAPVAGHGTGSIEGLFGISNAVSTKWRSELFLARGLDTIPTDLPVGQITKFRLLLEKQHRVPHLEIKRVKLQAIQVPLQSQRMRYKQRVGIFFFGFLYPSPSPVLEM